MEFFKRAAGSPARLGILPGTFNPVTVAHLALAHTALEFVDEVLFVLPRAFPHKPYSGASFEQRIDLLRDALADASTYSIAASEGGLFLEIAREAREAYAPVTRLSFLCGRDAAERIVGWDYGDPQALAGMFQEFDLLVASRAGEYLPPEAHARAVRTLPVPPDVNPISATDVRDRIRRREPWEHLVPAAVRDRVRRIYC